MAQLTGLVTARGHIAFGIFWTVAMLVIVIGFAGVGALRFSPWLLLLIPFVATRIAFRKTERAAKSTFLVGGLRSANLIIEVAMVAVFIYLYNLALLSYCPPPK